MGLRSRRARAAEQAAPAPEPTPEPTPEPIPELTAEQLAGLTPEAELRVLRAHVRALEQALAAVTEPPPPAPVLDPGVGLHRAQVIARAVAARVAADDDPRHAAARVAACLEQLSAAPGLARPVVAGEEAPQDAPPLEELPEPAPVLAAVDGPEVVLPVPPPATPEPRRSRRRPRGHAA